MAKGTWVVVDQRDGKIRKVSLELISKAADFGDEVAAVIIGQGIEGLAADCGKAGADKVYVADDAKFAQYNTGAYASQLAAMAKQYDPATIIFGHTAMLKDLAPRTAQKLETGLVTDCTDVEIAGGKLTFVRPIYAGKAFSKVTVDTTPVMATIRANIFDVTEAGKSPEVIKADIAATDADLYQTVKEFIPTISS